MPEVCRFYGIIIQIYYGDHLPAHFHALYAGRVAKITIDPFEVIDGSLSNRALGMVRDWVALHQQELREAFARAAALNPPARLLLWNKGVAPPLPPATSSSFLLVRRRFP